MFDGETFNAKEVLRYETNGNVVMNCAVLTKNKQTYLVAGQESHCQLFKVKCCVCNDGNDNVFRKTRKNNLNKLENSF